MRELGVRHVAQGCADKVRALLKLTRRLGIDPLAAACLVGRYARPAVDGGGRLRRRRSRTPIRWCAPPRTG